MCDFDTKNDRRSFSRAAIVTMGVIASSLCRIRKWCGTSSEKSQ
jgi:hypothetical protein